MDAAHETPDQILLRLARQMEEVTRGISEVMARQNLFDERLTKRWNFGQPRLNILNCFGVSIMFLLPLTPPI